MRVVMDNGAYELTNPATGCCLADRAEQRVTASIHRSRYGMSALMPSSRPLWRFRVEAGSRSFMMTLGQGDGGRILPGVCQAPAR